MAIRRARRAFECFGGPLCGRHIAKPRGGDVVVLDDGERQHYYRLCKAVTVNWQTQEEKASVIYWHYVGAFRSVEDFLENDSPPKILPPESEFSDFQ